jgi:hypothetical protein
MFNIWEGKKFFKYCFFSYLYFYLMLNLKSCLEAGNRYSVPVSVFKISGETKIIFFSFHTECRYRYLIFSLSTLGCQFLIVPVCQISYFFVFNQAPNCRNKFLLYFSSLY